MNKVTQQNNALCGTTLFLTLVLFFLIRNTLKTGFSIWKKVAGGDLKYFLFT